MSTFNLFEHMDGLKLPEVHFRSDPSSGLNAIVAIHSTKNGPALGGCRFIEYPDFESALTDAAKLARAMSYKAALINIHQGGGKAVILKPKSFDPKALFTAYGKFVNDLGGRYITAVDSGTNLEYMDIVHEQTDFVASHSGLNGSPSPYTAMGVFNGIRACAKFRYGTDSLEGKHVLVQGVGEVGRIVCELAAKAGARLSISDVDKDNLALCSQQMDVNIVAPEKVLETPCDIFAPCALGATVNETTINQLSCDIIAGAANNVLSKRALGQTLVEKDILMAPDYVINAGGLIYASNRYRDVHEDEINKQVENIYDSLLLIFERAKKEGKPTQEVADIIASERL